MGDVPADRTSQVGLTLSIRLPAGSNRVAPEFILRCMATTPDSPTARAPLSRHASHSLWVVRYGIGAVMVLGGIVMLIVSPAGLGADGFAMAVGGGLSVLLLNFMYRLSASSELDRARQDQAR